jgi:hypothetical protein
MEAIALWMPATDGTLALQGMNYRGLKATNR